jgi:16S rRNA (uracil1498-N3)-methyltransferase
LQNFKSLVDNASHYQLRFILHEKIDSALTIASELKLHEDVHSLLIVVGPEGGFTEDEIANTIHAGFKSISLGMRRLRTETAAIVAVNHALT